MGKRIYVGNLPYAVVDSDLTELFSKFGAVESAEVVREKGSNRSKGFGFVQMPNDQEALAAIEALNGTDLRGRNVAVNEARPKQEGGGGGGGGGGRPSWGGRGDRDRDRDGGGRSGGGGGGGYRRNHG